jgi:NDP-sugar pyrophosphorylase family protein
VGPDARVVGLVLRDELLTPQPLANHVIFMAGGLGSRLRPMTEETPKPLLTVGRKPLLETILEGFIEHGFRHFHMSVNYKAEQVKQHFGDGERWGVEIDYLEEDEQLGTAGPLGLLPEVPEEPILVMNADVLTKVNFRNILDFHFEQGASATMCVREYDFRVPFGVVNIERDRIVGIEEKPLQTFFVNAGIYVVSPELLDLVGKDEPLDMPEFFGRAIDAGHHAAVFPVREYWMDVGRLDDYERANGEFFRIFES